MFSLLGIFFYMNQSVERTSNPTQCGGAFSEDVLAFTTAPSVTCQPKMDELILSSG